MAGEGLVQTRRPASTPKYHSINPQKRRLQRRLMKRGRKSRPIYLLSTLLARLVCPSLLFFSETLIILLSLAHRDSDTFYADASDSPAFVSSDALVVCMCSGLCPLPRNASYFNESLSFENQKLFARCATRCWRISLFARCLWILGDCYMYNVESTLCRGLSHCSCYARCKINAWTGQVEYMFYIFTHLPVNN
jgi:hypothetical protein